MIDPNMTAEMLLQAADDLRGQRNFEQQVEYLLSPANDLFHLADIDLGLAARGHPMEQADRLLQERRIHLLKRDLLCGRQLEIDANITGQVSDAVDGSLFQLQYALVHQPFELRIGGARFLQQLWPRDF